MHASWTKLSLTCGLMLAVAALGCSRGDLPALGEVEGLVLADGQPLKGGKIAFVPADGGRTSDGVIGDDGRYRLIYSKDELGAKVGQHTVKISTENDVGGGERIPEKYNVTSELTAQVEGGRKNQIDFSLEGVKPAKQR